MVEMSALEVKFIQAKNHYVMKNINLVETANNNYRIINNNPKRITSKPVPYPYTLDYLTESDGMRVYIKLFDSRLFDHNNEIILRVL